MVFRFAYRDFAMREMIILKIKRIDIRNVRLGMVIADDVYTAGRQLVVNKGITIDERILDKLMELSIKWVLIYSIEKPSGKIVEGHLPRTHSEKLRASEAYQEFSAKYEERTESFKCELNDIANKNADVDIDTMFESSMEMLESDNNTYHVFDMLHNMMTFDDSTYSHSLNVAMIANILGKWLGMPEEEIKVITVAGMLHDVGKLLVPQELITKPGKLTEQEFKTIKEHTTRGYKLLMEKGVDETIARVALMHHEKCDGRTGEVVMINSQSLSNPIVKVGAEFLDLSTLPNVNIVNIL